MKTTRPVHINCPQPIGRNEGGKGRVKKKLEGAMSGKMINKLNPLSLASKKNSVCVGDKFKTSKFWLDPKGKPLEAIHIWEVIEIRPGGHVELFDKERFIFWPTYAKTVRMLERI